MIWERFFDDVADVLVVSPTSQSRLEKFNSVQILIMSPMHRRHVPIDAGTSPSLTTIWKPVCTEMLSYLVDLEQFNLMTSASIVSRLI